jgi:hypothetical protein
MMKSLYFSKNANRHHPVAVEAVSLAAGDGSLALLLLKLGISFPWLDIRLNLKSLTFYVYWHCSVTCTLFLL